MENGIFGLHIKDYHGHSDEHWQIGEGPLPSKSLFSHFREAYPENKYDGKGRIFKETNYDITSMLVAGG